MLSFEYIEYFIYHIDIEIDPILTQLVAQSPNLSEIALERHKYSGNSIDVDETTLVALGTHRGPHMKKVSLHIWNISYDSISRFCISCPNLIVFKLCSMGKITSAEHDACAHAIVTYCTKLEVLEIDS